MELTSPRILVVEDEGIIAQDIKNCLENLGYTVPEVVFTGREAIEKAEELRPDLVLMDIVLKGDIDGIETAMEIRRKFNIPIVYLTAYEDDKTLKRAKLTEPLGYILKPFEERYLRSSIEMALYKHKMESRLKENERWLGTILKSVGEAVIVADNLACIRFMNPMAESITGWSSAEALGKNVTEILKLINEKTRLDIVNPVVTVLKENVTLGKSNHTILISKSGSEIFIDHNASPMRDEKGIITGVVLVIQDITDRRIAELTVKESENKYRNLFDYANDSIFVLSFSGNIISMNNEASRLLGYEKDELQGLNYFDLVKSEPKENEEILRKLKKNGSHSFETLMKKKDGSLVDVEVSKRIIELLDEKVIQVIGRDISGRKKVQQQINMLAQAMKSISDSISITDLNNKLIFVNDGFIKTYGYSREELIGKSMNLVRSPKNSQVLYKQIKEGTVRGGWQGELLNITREGVEFPIILSTSLVRDEKGSMVAFVGVATDITERKRLETAIRDSEKDYKGLFENAHDAIIIFRPEDETILDVNQSACSVYGFTKPEFIGMSHASLTKNIVGGKDYIEEALRKEGSVRLESYQSRKDGTEMLLEINATVVDYKGQRAIMSINRDITERRKAEEALRLSEAKFRAVAETTPVVIFIYRGSKLLFGNPYAVDLTGYSLAELMQMDFWRIVHPDNRGLVREKILDSPMNSDATARYEFKINTKSGEEKWVDFSGTLIDYEGKPAVLGVLIDVTERKTAEKAILDSERNYKNLAENAPIAVTRISLGNKKYEYVNGEFFKQTGYTMEEYNALSREELMRMSFPDDLKKVSAFYKDWESKGFKGTLQIDYRVYNRYREVKWLDTFIYADFDENGTAVAMNQICIDITERKKAEEAIREQEKKYKNLAENAPIAVTRLLPDKKLYEFVNDEFVRQSGYSMEEFNKLSNEQLLNIIYPEDNEKVFEAYKTWQSTGHKGTQHLDYRIINRFKKILWLDTYLYADFDPEGNLVAINQICIDITGQKNTQEALRASDKRFKALIENSTDMVTLLDKNAVILYDSPSIERILGYTLEEKIGRNGFEFIHPDDVEMTRKTFEEIINSSSSAENIRYRIKHKNGHWLWVETTANNLLNEPSVGAIVVNFRDITERKKAEEEIILQKSYFQQLFENSPEGIVILDNHDKVVNVNKGFEKLFQYPADEIKDKSINSILVPESLLEQASQMSLFVLKGEVIHRETIRKRKDGSLVDVSVLAYPIKLGDNQIGVYGIYSDISERKETEKALRTSEERYRAFVKHSSEGIWRYEILEPISIKIPVDEQVKHLFRFAYLAECNDNVARMYGYETADEIIGAHLNEMLLDTDPHNFEYLKSFIKSSYRLSDAESHEVDKNGNLKYFVNNLVGIIENDFLVRAWGTQRDITESKLAEEELRKTQFRLATLLSNLPDVVLYETGSDKEFISENVMDLLGYQAEKFTKDRNFFPGLVHPGDLKVMDKKQIEWNKTGNPGILNQEFRVRRADGIYIWLEDHMIMVKNTNETDHMAGVLIDINEHKSAEEKLRQLAEKLSLSNKELEQFAYVASHDLQEPLRMVASYIQLLQRRYKGKLSNEADEFIGYAVDGVVRMKSLINDLLAYSRVNTQEMKFEPTDLTKVIHQAVVNLRASIEEKGGKVIYEGLPVVMANPLHMNQLFQNLISNAIKFRGTEPPVVNISARHAGDEWILSVSDNGIGVEKEFTDRIFVIFQRLHNYAEYPGTGIGLAICKKIIEKAGGHIWVESEPGKGSTFSFTIPDVTVS
jgi:PAS domain S-box-containing protein